jgi:hypothetical protein
MFDVDEGAGVVDEDATTTVHHLRFGLALGGVKASTSAADKVVNRHHLARLKVAGGDGMFGNGYGDIGARRATALFTKLACRASWGNGAVDGGSNERRVA